MKKIIYNLVALILLVMPVVVHAASGTITIIGSDNVVIGNNITYTVRLSSDVNIISWEMNLSYDKNYLKLISTSSESGGTKMANSSTSGLKRKDYTFTFAALKTGSTSLNINSYEVISFDSVAEIPVKSYTKTTKIITKEQLYASYSKDNYLKNLEVEGYEISPEFDKNTLDYSVVVPEETKSIKVTAYVNDNKSVVNGEGTLEVTPGSNKFNIVVKAQNGDERTYTLTVDVKDQNPINVTVDNINYTVVKIKDTLTSPDSFKETTVTIDSFEVPAFYNEIIDYTLVGLKDEEGNISLFKYQDNTYEKYKELNFGNITVVPLDLKEKAGYIKTNYQIMDYDLDCLALNNSSRFLVIYGQNVVTGEEGYYTYDTKDKTLIKYDDEIQEKYAKEKTTLLYGTGVFALTTLLSLICNFVLLKKRKMKKPVSKTEEAKENDPNQIKEKVKKKKDNNDAVE